MKNDAFYCQEIRRRLTDDRYRHSLCVADSAAMLARRYGGDEAKAYTAGLLHDILKDTPKPELKAYLLSRIPDADPTLLSQPALWHSIAGAEFLQSELEMDDAEIYAAVRYHTSGRAGMSLLEKIVFTADFISADRKYPGVDEVRRMAESSLEEAMEEGLNFTIKQLCDRRQPIYADTIHAYNDIVLQRLLRNP